MRAWYEGHDKAYIKRKENGWVGWSEKQVDVDESISVLGKIIHYPYVPEKGNFLELGCGAGEFYIMDWKIVRTKLQEELLVF